MKAFKFTRPTALAGCLFLLAPPGFSQDGAKSGVPGKGGGRDVVTEETLRKEVAKSQKLPEAMKSAALPLTAARPSTDNTVYARSIILFDGETHTLVPLGSILTLPAEYRDHIISRPAGDFTGWPAFLAKNTAWLAGHEVTLTMAKGDEKEARKVLKEIEHGTKVLVSLYKSCPISILEPAPPAKAASPQVKPTAIPGHP
ncbi:MAG: hypothetical protein EOP86_01340 [Verrucomicrobiaceae bacterium]|nr:MAG: hypothetical protein EOP86_01340 [Verrucomicrobiaceae bacterium]